MTHTLTSLSQKKIAVLATGGTIAGTASSSSNHVGYQAAQLGVADLLGALPAVHGLGCIAEQVAQIDSKDMDFATWRLLAERCRHWLAQEEIAGLVITHGTDTLEETAYFLRAVLHADKPVVLTCAMRPATALLPDGPQNLLDALTLAALPGARGVLVVCAGVVHAAEHVQKLYSYRLDAFGSGDAGPMGHVEQGVLRRLCDWPHAGPGLPFVPTSWPTDASAWPRVEIVMNYAGAGAALVDAMVRDGVQGLVAAGTGNGSLHLELQAALLRAQAAGVRVLRSSRCAYGHVLPRADDQLPDAGTLSPVKARIRLMLELLG